MSTHATLLRRNADFAEHRFPSGLRIMPSLRTVVLGCVDPRVDPAAVLGLELGEAAVARNVGGRVTPALLRELAMLGALGRAEGVSPDGDWTLVVLHHTDCGIAKLAGDRPSLAGYFGIPEADLDAKAVADPRAAVAVDVEALVGLPGLPPIWSVTGLVYDVATGLVEEVVPPTRVRGA